MRHAQWYRLTRDLIQTAALVLAVAVAYKVGHEQAEISRQQHALSQRQAKITEDQLELQYRVSVELHYLSDTKKLRITDRGQSSVSLTAAVLPGSGDHIESGASIAPGASIDVNAEWLMPWFADHPDLPRTITLYFRNERSENYAVTAFIIRDHGDVYLSAEASSRVNPPPPAPPSVDVPQSDD